MKPLEFPRDSLLIGLLALGALLVPVRPYFTGGNDNDVPLPSSSGSERYLPLNPQSNIDSDNDYNHMSEDNEPFQSQSYHHHHHHNSGDYSHSHYSHNQNHGQRDDRHNHHHHNHNHHHHHQNHHDQNQNQFQNIQQDYRYQPQSQFSSSTEQYFQNPNPDIFGENNNDGQNQQQDGPYYNSNSHMNTNKYGHAQSHVGNCRLPDSWKGRWFQSGSPNPILIDSKFIEGKGTCYESSEDKFLFVEKKSCYRCLVINERHRNVLEYKESSYCEDKDTLENLCSQIPGDAQLYSLFRIDAQPIDCPFKGPFLFSYNRGHGVCKSPMSRVDVCTEPSKLLLKYQACPDVPRTESTMEELQCLAEWRDSAYHYLVGKLNYKLVTSNEDRYRCFIFERTKGHIIKIAESGDATCIGLSSPSEGARTLTFQKIHESGTKCKFPSWVAMHQWLSLDGKLIVRTNHKNSTMSVTTTTEDLKREQYYNPQFSSIQGAYTGAFTGGPFGSAPIIDDRSRKYLVDGARIQCQSKTDINEDHVAIIAHHTVGCTSTTLCIHFFRRDTHVIELQLREKGSAHADEYDCGRPEAMRPNLPYVTLITSRENSRRCPYLGKYMTTTITQNGRLISSPSQNGDPCSSHSASLGGETAMANNNGHHHRGSFHSLVVGCGHRATMDFHSKCLPHEPITSYECMGSWEDNGIGFLIASPMSRSSGSALRYCFSYSETDEGLQVYSSSESCLRDGSPNLDGIWAFNLTVDGQCAEPVTTGGVGGGPSCDFHMILLVIATYFLHSTSFMWIMNTIGGQLGLVLFPLNYTNNFGKKVVFRLHVTTLLVAISTALSSSLSKIILPFERHHHHDKDRTHLRLQSHEQLHHDVNTVTGTVTEESYALPSSRRRKMTYSNSSSSCDYNCDGGGGLVIVQE